MWLFLCQILLFKSNVLVCLNEKLEVFVCFGLWKRSSFLLHTHRAKASNPFLLKPYVPPRLTWAFQTAAKPQLHSFGFQHSSQSHQDPLFSESVSVSKWKQTHSGQNDGFSASWMSLCLNEVSSQCSQISCRLQSPQYKEELANGSEILSQ